VPISGAIAKLLQSDHAPLLEVIVRLVRMMLEVIVRLVRMLRNMVIRTVYVLRIQMVSQM